MFPYEVKRKRSKRVLLLAQSKGSHAQRTSRTQTGARESNTEAPVASALSAPALPKGERPILIQTV